MTPLFAAADILRYLVLVVLWTLAGRALLSLAQQRALGTVGWLLAPAVAQAFVAVLLGMSAVMGVPIRQVSIPMWIAVVELAILGFAFECAWRAKHRGTVSTSKDALLIGSIVVIVPSVVLMPYFVHGFSGYAGTAHPDAWSYTVFGDYLWNYPRLTHWDLAPVHKWASNLSGTRFVSSAELAWLATITHWGDTQAGFGLLLTLATFINGCTCAAIAMALGLPRWLILLVAVGGGSGNWITGAILVSNLDNLLALSYLPALAVLGFHNTSTSSRGRLTIVALLAAGAFYTYPEFAAVSLCCASLYFVDSYFKQPARRRFLSVLLCGLLTAILVAPYATEVLQFVGMQLTSGVSAQARPALGYYAGLVDPARWPAALWALGAEHANTPWSRRANLAAIAASLLAVVGFGRLALNRNLASLATIVILAIGFNVFVWRYEYGYGAYKFILLGWWLIVVAVAFGVRECSRIHPVATMVAAMVASLTFAVSATRSIHDTATQPQPDIKSFRALRGAEYAAKGAPIAVAVADNTAAHWATYFLRDVPVRLVSYSGYLATRQVQIAGEAKQVPWNSVRLLLTDAADSGPIIEQQQRWTPLWGNEHYTLWDTGDAGWAVVWKVDNGYPLAAGPDMIWVADKPVTLTTTANMSGVAKIHAGVSTSQALPQTAPPIRVRITDGAGGTCEWTVGPQGYDVSLGLEPGENAVTLAKTSPLGVNVAPAADQGFPFMVGIVKPTLEFTRGTADTSAYCPR